MTTTTETATLRDWAAEVYAVNEANGWFEDDRTVGDDLALLHSEVSEALEAFRRWGLEDMTDSECRNGTTVLAHAFADGHLCKPEGVGSELADVLIRLLDTIARRDIVPQWLDGSLASVPVVKPLVAAADAAEWSFGDHVAYLHRLIARGNLIALLYALVAVAVRYEVDLEFEYHRKIAFNRTRGHRHGGKRL